MKKVGEFTEQIINHLQLNIPAGTPILIGDSNVDHIKSRHSYEYAQYYNRLPDIISNPNYIGLSPKDNSVQFVKEFCINSEYISVAVKVTPKDQSFVKTMQNDIYKKER